jgi:SAM-dependent methyltransferase
MSDSANIVGNVYDKYGTRNPIARRLMAGFLASMTALYRRAEPARVLEVGCGEGHLSDRLVRSGPRPERFVALDLEIDQVAEGLDPLIEFREGSAYELPYADGEFDLVILPEVLEHLDRPEVAAREAARVAARAVIVSVPWEPVWRILNLMRLRYVGALGNTPGHIQHFGRRSLLRLLEPHLRVVGIEKPLPWTVVLGEPITGGPAGAGAASATA